MNLPIRGYKAVEGRGLIDENTTKYDFYDKAHEEQNEIYEACDVNEDNKMSDHEAEEVADRITALQNNLIHCGRKVEIELEKVCIKNENRKV